MQKKSGFFFLFLTLLVLGSLLFAFSQNLPSFSWFSGEIFSPVRENIVSFFHKGNGGGEVVQLREENLRLQKSLRDQKKLEADVKALRDQFETESIPTQSLLPAKIVALRSFVPGVSLPESLILNKGAKDHVIVGQVVIYQENVVGRISKVSAATSLVDLLYHQKSAISAKTLKTNALGLVQGQGQGVMQLQGVVLSEKLEVGDQVLTKGDANGENIGYPPDLVIGKILSVDKKPSALFQSAEIESLLQIAKLTTVFIMLESHK